MVTHMNCPLCDHDQARILPFHYEWEGARFDLGVCRTCGHISLCPMPAAEQIQSFYGEEYFETGLHGLDRENATYIERADAAHAQTLDFVRKELLSRHPKAHSFFEIGAATGHLLQATQEAGISRTGGVEISSEAVAHARSTFGFELICANVDDADVSVFETGWDLVYAGDVLEHVRNPDRLVSTMAHLVADDGVVVVRIPATFELISTRVAGACLSLLGKSMRLPDAPYHLHEFKAGPIRELFARHFDDVEIINDIVSPTELNLKGLRPGYVGKLALHLLNYPVTKLFGVFGDRFTIIAKRPRRENIRT